MKTFRPLSLRAASLALLAAALPLAQADETHYVGPDGGSWSSPYWDAGNPNGSLDVYNLTNFRTILDQDYTVRNFTSLGAFTATRTLTGALADRASVVKVSNEFLIDGGGLSNLTVQGVGGHSLVLSGSGNNVLTNVLLKDANLSGGYARVFGTVTADGTTTLNGSELRVLDQSALNVASSGSLAGQGLVSRENGSTFATIDGTLRASGGTLYWDVWQGGGSGSLTADAGANLVLRGNFNGTGSGATVGASLGGTVTLDAGGGG